MRSAIDPLHAADDVDAHSVTTLALALLDQWNVGHPQRAQLLPHLMVIASASQSGSLSFPAIESARRLLGVHAALRTLFPSNPEMVSTWVHRRNAALGGESPLTVMLAEGSGGVERVRRLLLSQLLA